MTVLTVEDRHIFRCDLCGCLSTNPLTLDLHRKTLGGPNDPEVHKPPQEAILDVCYECRYEIQHSHDGSSITELQDYEHIFKTD